MNATLLHLSIVAGVAAWSLLFWINWNWIQQGGQKRIFTVLAGVHLFRYIGLIALIPTMGSDMEVVMIQSACPKSILSNIC
jgi:hypothetical protein